MASWLDAFNSYRLSQLERNRILTEHLGSVGPSSKIRPTFYCTNGHNIHLGERSFVNYHGQLFDAGPIVIGGWTAVGPEVRIYATEERPVTIGHRCWIGGKCAIMEGVRIGDDCIVAAGSVVAADVPNNSTVGGVPARAISSKRLDNWPITPLHITDDVERLRLGYEVSDLGAPLFDSFRERDRQFHEAFNSRGSSPQTDLELFSLLSEYFGSIGANTTVQRPIIAEWAQNMHLGVDVHIDANCVFIALGRVSIGDGTKIGSGVHVYAMDHPRRTPANRPIIDEGRSRLDCWAIRGVPITIGRRCWIGDGAILMPGVTIGDGAMIARAAIVTRDVKEGAVVERNPTN